MAAKPEAIRSIHVDRFNHDEDAPGYDLDVANESAPIRAGYDSVLSWVAAQGDIRPTSRVLELGSGTGNLTLRLASCAELVCVDVSESMSEIAKTKLAHTDLADTVEFVTDDLLAFVTGSSTARFTHILSSYALHHLDDSEKQTFFEAAARALAPGGQLVVGDLMFESAVSRTALLEHFRSTGDVELAEELEDEYLWNIATAVPALRVAGFENIVTRRFSDLSWGLTATTSTAT